MGEEGGRRGWSDMIQELKSLLLALTMEDSHEPRNVDGFQKLERARKLILERKTTMPKP